MTFYPFGEYLPDQPVFGNPGALEAKNVRPQAQSYQPHAGLTAIGATLSATVIGAAVFRPTGGGLAFFLGNATGLYINEGVSLSGTTSNTFSDRSAIGGYGAAGYWEFARFGEEVFAANSGDITQYYNLSAGGTFATLTMSFTAAHVSNVRDFLVFGNTNAVEHRVRWSAIGDPHSYTIAAATQADFQDLPAGGGAIRKIVGGEYGVIFQEHAITRMTYAKSPVVWQFDQVITGIGTSSAQSVAKWGRTIFFAGWDGIYALHDGIELEPIGANKVDQFYLDDVAPLSRLYSQGFVDPVNRLYYLRYASNDYGVSAPKTSFDKGLIYDIDNRRWARMSLTSQVMFSVPIDPLGISSAGAYRRLLGAFSENNRLSVFTGGNLPSIIDTAETQIFADQRALVQEVRPVVDCNEPMVQVGKRDTFQQSNSFSASVSINTIGYVPALANGRYHRFRVHTKTGCAWTHAQGVDVTAVPVGRY